MIMINTRIHVHEIGTLIDEETLIYWYIHSNKFSFLLET